MVLFQNFKSPVLTRYVFSTELRTIILAEVNVDGSHYALKEDYIAELEADVLSLDAQMFELEGGNTLPAWAAARLIPVTAAKNGR